MALHYLVGLLAGYGTATGERLSDLTGWKLKTHGMRLKERELYHK